MCYAIGVIIILAAASVIFSVSKALATFKKMVQEDELSAKADENGEN